MKKLSIILTLLFCSLTTHAGLFKITNRTGDCSVICNELENQVNQKLPSADASSYLEGMGNSSVMAQKGLGVDYASDIILGAIGVGLGFGADLGNTSSADALSGDVKADQIGGFAAAAAFMAGINLGVFSSKLNRFVGYLHFASASMPKRDGFTGEVSTFGMHLQYKLFTPVELPGGGIKWGGLDLTTGFETSNLDVQLVKTLSETYTDAGQSASFSGTTTIGAKVSTFSIPIEISTNLRLLYFSTIYGGFGMDINTGKAEAIANLTGNVTLGGLASGGGTASLDLGQEDGPSNIALRSFIGIQANLTALRVFAQVNKGSNDTLGVNVGVRLAW